MVSCKTIPRTSLLNKTPVTVSMILEPKTRFTVEVMDTTIPLASTIEVWLCTESYHRTRWKVWSYALSHDPQERQKQVGNMQQGGYNSVPGHRIVEREKNAHQRTSVKFLDINAPNDLSGISSIFPEPSLKEGSDIRVLERVFKYWI